MVIALYNLCERYGTCSDENNTDVNNYATSTIHKYLNETYYNTLPQQDREKLGTKAVQEEFHGIDHGDGTYTYKQLYNWNSVNCNIWLPSLSELVGIDPNHYNAASGVYYSAMQGLNTSIYYYTDVQGGNQFAYFQQFNASGGGGEAIMNACNQQISWLRSPHCGRNGHTWAVLSRLDMDASANSLATLSRAVHPAVLYNPERPIKQTGLLCFYRRIICLYLMEQRQSWKYAVEQYGRKQLRHEYHS